MSKRISETGRDTSGRSTQRTYTDEFRRDVVRLITEEGYSIPAAAKSCGVSDQTVRNWHRKFVTCLLLPRPDFELDLTQKAVPDEEVNDGTETIFCGRDYSEVARS